MAEKPASPAPPAASSRPAYLTSTRPPPGTPWQTNDDYNPHDFRDVPNPTNNAETLIHLLKGSLGTGILAMPQAMHYSGYVIGSVSTFLIGALCTYCLHVLVRSQYVMCKRQKVPLLTYPESMLIALQQGPKCLNGFAGASFYIVDGFLIFYQIGICCVYVVFVSGNIKQVCDAYFDPINLRFYMCFILFPLILINLVRNLKLLAPFSTLANLITFVSLGIILSYICVNVPPISERRVAGELHQFPLYFGTTLFALEAVGVIISLEGNMKDPAAFRRPFGVLNVGMSIIVILYVLIGLLGYLKYGAECKGSITLNLPESDGLAQTVKILMAIAVYISYALQCYVPIHIIWSQYMLPRLETNTKKIIWELFLRIIIVIITFLLAVAIPNLGLFISLIGAFSLSALGLAFPAIIEICVYWDDLGKFNYILIKDSFLIIFGLLGLIIGTYTSVLEIVESFTKSD